MAAPSYVPQAKDDTARVYASPPRRPDSWMADRPAEVLDRQPEGPGLGFQGPDQGYALKLARRFEGRLVLVDGESEHDAMTGCVSLAMRRASLFGRAPMIHDLTVAFLAWGFLAPAPADLIDFRRPYFAEVAHPHHYLQLRDLVAAVPEWILRLHHDDVREAVTRDPGAAFRPAA